MARAWLPVALALLLAAPAAGVNLVSITPDGRAGSGPSWGRPAVSATGRYVAFTSSAADLVANDVNGQRDVFLLDRVTGATTCVSVTTAGQPMGGAHSPAISGSGRYVAFIAPAGALGGQPAGEDKLYLRDCITQTTTEISWIDGHEAAGSFSSPSISADGGYVAFAATDTDLVAGDTNGVTDVFVWRRATLAVTRLSLPRPGTGDLDGDCARPRLAATGAYVAYDSTATNLAAADTDADPDVFRTNLAGTETICVSAGHAAGSHSSCPDLSADGRYVVYQTTHPLAAGDTNGQPDIARYDCTEATYVWVSCSAGAGVPAASTAAAVDLSGRYVAFQSAGRFLAGDTGDLSDIYLKDVETGDLCRVGLAWTGAQGDGDAASPALSGDGLVVCFASAAANLAPTDANGQYDLFATGNLHLRLACPPNLTVTPTAPAAAAVTWGTVAGATGSRLEGRVGSGSFTTIGTLPAGQTSCTEVGLDPEQIYQYRVVAVGATESDYSNTAVLDLRAAPPAAPTSLQVDTGALTPVSAPLTWVDCSDNEAGFALERRVGSGEFEPLAEVGAGVQAYTDTTCEPGATYTWRVCAFRQAGARSTWAVSAAATTPALLAPATLTAVVGAGPVVHLAWADDNPTLDSFSLERRAEGGTFEQIAVPAAAATGFDDFTCHRGVRYTYRLRACLAGHCSPCSAEATAVIPSFDDVPPTSAQFGYVEAIHREGITSGCSQAPPLFCPNSPVTRGQMAVFLCRAAGWTPVTPATPTFSDVPKTSPQYGYIEAIAGRGVTAGCGGGKFCPDSPVTRGQMAVFLCRAAGLATQHPATPTFTDVPSTSQQYTYIEGMFTAGITAGCVTTPPRQYCPGAAVTRGQMAVFLCRAFDLTLP